MATSNHPPITNPSSSNSTEQVDGHNQSAIVLASSSSTTTTTDQGLGLESFEPHILPLRAALDKLSECLIKLVVNQCIESIAESHRVIDSTSPPPSHQSTTTLVSSSSSSFNHLADPHELTVASLEQAQPPPLSIKPNPKGTFVRLVTTGDNDQTLVHLGQLEGVLSNASGLMLKHGISYDPSQVHQHMVSDLEPAELLALVEAKELQLKEAGSSCIPHKGPLLINPGQVFINADFVKELFVYAEGYGYYPAVCPFLTRARPHNNSCVNRIDNSSCTTCNQTCSESSVEASTSTSDSSSNITGSSSTDPSTSQSSSRGERAVLTVNRSSSINKSCTCSSNGSKQVSFNEEVVQVTEKILQTSVTSSSRSCSGRIQASSSVLHNNSGKGGSGNIKMTSVREQCPEVAPSSTSGFCHKCLAPIVAPISFNNAMRANMGEQQSVSRNWPIKREDDAVHLVSMDPAIKRLYSHQRIAR